MIGIVAAGVYVIGRALWAIVKVMCLIVAFVFVALGLLSQFVWLKSKPYARRAWSAVRGEFMYG